MNPNLAALPAIALNTFREAIRNRVLHGIVLLAFVLVAGSFFLGKLSVENDARVIRDMGMTFLNLVLVVVAIFSGVNLLFVEIERKTIYTIVTKPIARWSFIVGKYLGLLLTLLAVEGFIAVVFLGLLALRGDPILAIHIQSLVLIFGEAALVASIATLFSSFSSPFLSGMFTFGMFLLGRLREALFLYAGKFGGEVLGAVLKAVGVILPDLTLHRADLQLAYLTPLHWGYVSYTMGYSLLYASVVIVLSCVIFHDRDFV
jgi:ABC-type transport system involved in multi-copper enzyme maturation permease subunit